jgi:SAM-dependent methyltransferase
MTDRNIIPQISDDLVKMHVDYLVPIIFAPWAHHLTEIAAIESGHHVLDVASGTGVVARAARMEVGMRGKVTGLDHNEDMLAVARQQASPIDWHLGDAAHLPFEDNSFDRVLCQFALTFIDNRIAAIREMLRVCKPDPLDHSHGYSALVQLTRKYAGVRAANRLASPWSLSESGQMDALLQSAGVNEYECHERVGIARFPSIESFIEVHLRLAGEFNNIGSLDLTGLLSAAEHVLAPITLPGGEVAADLNASIFVLYPD